MLSHPHNQDSLIADMSRIWTPEELIAAFIAPPVFQPGTSWSYCNTNYFLLGMIIREATGNEFYTELRNRFYTPLALNSFAIPAFEPLNSPVAHLWLDITGDGVQDDAHDFYMNYLSLNSTAGAAGGYFSTPTDCTKWMRSYMRGDLLSPELMAEAKTTVPAGSTIERYGLGLMHKTSGFLGYEAYGHGGDLAYHASSWYFPELDQSITVFTNDNTETSWTLLPVVRELLRTYITNQTASVDESVLEECRISPIPFDDQLVVSWKNTSQSTDFTLELQDAAGRSIAVQREHSFSANRFESRFEELGTLPAGIYFVSISGNNAQLKTIKVMK
ncbi:D-alanyl-D-alanine carboxypeptidase precursor [compost metagenome]